MRILHVANFAFGRHGNAGYDSDRKISAGFVRNGHFVYDFSLRDAARQGAFLRRPFTVRRANTEIIRVSERMRPDLILFSAMDTLLPDTLKKIRQHLPQTRLALWATAPLFDEEKTALLQQQARHVDAVFASTGGEWLAQLAPDSTLRGYLPHPVDPATDVLENHRRRDFDYELIYCSHAEDDAEQQIVVQALQRSLRDIALHLPSRPEHERGSASDDINALATARMGLSLGQRNDMPLHSSARIAQLTGNGLLALTPRIPELPLLYRPDEVSYFDSFDELTEQIRHFRDHPEAAARVAEAGWQRAHRSFPAHRIARYMEEATFSRVFSEAYEWQDHVFDASPMH